MNAQHAINRHGCRARFLGNIKPPGEVLKVNHSGSIPILTSTPHPPHSLVTLLLPLSHPAPAILVWPLSKSYLLELGIGVLHQPWFCLPSSSEATTITGIALCLSNVLEMLSGTLRGVQLHIPVLC